jgi:hypothetical protein
VKPPALARLPVAPAVLGAAVLVGVVRILMAVGQPFSADGDQAVIELQVRLASHFRVVLGPYDRFGWHHLGPSYFYLLAPLYVFGGDHTRALSAGQLLLNAVFALSHMPVWYEATLEHEGLHAAEHLV